MQLLDPAPLVNLRSATRAQKPAVETQLACLMQRNWCFVGGRDDRTFRPALQRAQHSRSRVSVGDMRAAASLCSAPLPRRRTSACLAAAACLSLRPKRYELVAHSATLRAPDRRPSRIAGRKVPASTPSLSRLCIAALVAGAELLRPPASDWALELADFWNSNIERWTSVAGTALAKRLAVPGYYVRVLPLQILERPDIIRQVMPIRNRSDHVGVPADDAIGTEFLQLVRFGLRNAEDPLILASIRVADALLKTETPCGPVWHRYNGDGYGEHDDGSAYDGTGRGRGWPLLTGERGHYEVAAGRDPWPYLEAMSAMASPGGMLPEQLWDADPIPGRRLMPGRPTGSAMPLVWAHAEFIKLLISRQLGQPVDQPRTV